MYRMMMALTFLFLLLTGCSNHENMPKNDGGTVVAVIETNKEKEFLEGFKKEFPNVQIVVSVMNKEGDLILLYNSFGENEKVYFAVVSKHGLNAIGLGDQETRLQFANGADSLKLQDSNRFIVKTVDLKNGKHIDFQITTEYNQKLNQTNIKIKSIEAP